MFCYCLDGSVSCQFSVTQEDNRLWTDKRFVRMRSVLQMCDICILRTEPDKGGVVYVESNVDLELDFRQDTT